MKFIGPYLRGDTTDFYRNNQPFDPRAPFPVPPPGPQETEDCLFLDVIVPRGIFARRRGNGNGKRAPVLVWIYGGGYTGGDKAQYPPAGLIEQGGEDADGGFIYVALNYRVRIHRARRNLVHRDGWFS